MLRKLSERHRYLVAKVADCASSVLRESHHQAPGYVLSSSLLTMLLDPMLLLVCNLWLPPTRIGLPWDYSALILNPFLFESQNITSEGNLIQFQTMTYWTELGQSSSSFSVAPSRETMCIRVALSTRVFISMFMISENCPEP